MRLKLTQAILACLLVVGLVSGCGGASSPSDKKPEVPSATETKPATSAPATTTTTPAPTQTADKLKWNMTDTSVETNGNFTIAAAAALGTSPADLAAKAEAADPATVLKATYKYFGKPLKFTGEVGLAEEYPPGNDIAKKLGVSSEISEIVIATDDDTVIDFIMLGSSGDVNVGDTATVYGYAAGKAEVPNKIGGTLTHVIVVGTKLEKVQQ